MVIFVPEIVMVLVIFILRALELTKRPTQYFLSIGISFFDIFLTQYIMRINKQLPYSLLNHQALLRLLQMKLTQSDKNHGLADLFHEITMHFIFYDR